ncbi:MAG: type I restriction enzyme HsdR N-terminal domain-containing protein [Desulfosalsimonadaceae bacterium]
MTANFSNHRVITDFVTGKPVLDVGPEANRQAVEKYLVNEKGYAREEIVVDMDLILDVSGKPYHTKLDLVVFVDHTMFMVVKCAAGSLGSREREAVYAARIAGERPMPIAIASDGHSALVFDAIRRKQIGSGLDAIPSPETARQILAKTSAVPLPADRQEKEKIIFRSYDIMNVNTAENSCSSD